MGFLDNFLEHVWWFFSGGTFLSLFELPFGITPIQVSIFSRPFPLLLLKVNENFIRAKRPPGSHPTDFSGFLVRFPTLLEIDGDPTFVRRAAPHGVTWSFRLCQGQFFPPRLEFPGTASQVPHHLLNPLFLLFWNPRTVPPPFFSFPPFPIVAFCPPPTCGGRVGNSVFTCFRPRQVPRTNSCGARRYFPRTGSHFFLHPALVRGLHFSNPPHSG